MAEETKSCDVGAQANRFARYLRSGFAVVLLAGIKGGLYGGRFDLGDHPRGEDETDAKGFGQHEDVAFDWRSQIVYRCFVTNDG